MKHAKSYSSDLQNELLIVRHSGEIPEVALHGSLFFLSRDPEGPGLTLSSEEILELKQMAVKRYREIIERDLNPGNRDKRIYRGLARCIANWQRMELFCCKENFSVSTTRRETANRLILFIKNEISDVLQNSRSSSVNCHRTELKKFAENLGLNPEELPEGWAELCPHNCWCLDGLHLLSLNPVDKCCRRIIPNQRYTQDPATSCHYLFGPDNFLDRPVSAFG